MDEKRVDIRERSCIEDGIDLPPEYCRYRDEGCGLSASCLHCPFPRCLRHEESDGGARWLREPRAAEMASMLAAGKKTKEIAAVFGVCQRTVQRVLKALRETARGPEV
jgi:hypothetical protein